jgi:hypothetical protein
VNRTVSYLAAGSQALPKVCGKSRISIAHDPCRHLRGSAP